MDHAIQEVIDLIIRDFCLSWFRDVGEDETAFVEILNKQVSYFLVLRSTLSTCQVTRGLTQKFCYMHAVCTLGHLQVPLMFDKKEYFQKILSAENIYWLEIQSISDHQTNGKT